MTKHLSLPNATFNGSGETWQSVLIDDFAATDQPELPICPTDEVAVSQMLIIVDIYGNESLIQIMDCVGEKCFCAISVPVAYTLTAVHEVVALARESNLLTGSARMQVRRVLAQGEFEADGVDAGIDAVLKEAGVTS